MINTALKILSMLVLLAGCSSESEGTAQQDIPRTPPFESSSPAGQFHALASKGPVSKSVCAEFGGAVIAPIDYDEPVVVSQGVAIYKHKKTNEPRIGVSFITDNSFIVTIYTCAWPVASY